MQRIEVSESESPSNKRALKLFRGAGAMQQLALMAMCFLLAVGMQMNFPRYLSPINVEVMLGNFVTEGIMALGMTIVMITGGIDISVAAVLQFAAIVVGLLMKAGTPIPTAIVLTLIASAAVGWINVTLMNLFNVHPFIVTLATLLTIRGANIVITDAGTVTGVPEEFSYLGRGFFADIPHLRVSLVLFAVLAIVIGYALKNHRFLQQGYFIGGNRRAARMSGVKVERFLTFTYVLNAVLAGVAGIVICSQNGAASISFGQNAELRTITTVAIGGASLSGGTGTIFGTVLGWLFLAMIYNAFAMTGVNTYWQDVAIGSMLMTAVFFGEYLKRRQVAR
jgi:ribose/xylose/arabinose/galactoside ABC-type transport system permease subunit